MNVRNRMMPYELTAGSTQALYKKWLERAKAEIEHGSWWKYRRTMKALVRDFDHLPIDETIWKPKVGVVGEILVKYHPAGAYG